MLPTKKTHQFDAAQWQSSSFGKAKRETKKRINKLINERIIENQEMKEGGR